MRIAFVSPTSAGLFAETLGYTGGAEIQQYLLAQALSRRGHEPVFVVADRPGLRVSPIRYIPAAYPLSARHVLERAAGTQALWQALARADAAVYVQQGAGAITLETALFARATGRRSVYIMAHDNDWSGRLLGRPGMQRLLFRAGTRLVSAIVTQTERQREEVGRRWGIPATVIRGGVRMPAPAGHAPKEPAVLWAASLRWYKHPERLLEVAAQCPEIAFWAAGGAWVGAGDRDAQAAESFRTRAATLPNVRWLGLLDNAAVLDLQRRASVFLSTSESEGFPQTFLEAWANETPVVTCGVDPDEVLCRHGLGIHAPTVEDLGPALRLLLGDEPMRRQMGERACRYVAEHHDLERIADAYAALFASLAGGPAPDGR